MVKCWYKSYYLHCLLQIYKHIPWIKIGKQDKLVLTLAVSSFLWTLRYVCARWSGKAVKLLWKPNHILCCFCFLIFFYMCQHMEDLIFLHIYQSIYIFIYKLSTYNSFITDIQQQYLYTLIYLDYCNRQHNLITDVYKQLSTFHTFKISVVINLILPIISTF